jgi:hypothetical protein
MLIFLSTRWGKVHFNYTTATKFLSDYVAKEKDGGMAQADIEKYAKDPGSYDSSEKQAVAIQNLIQGDTAKIASWDLGNKIIELEKVRNEIGKTLGEAPVRTLEGAEKEADTAVRQRIARQEEIDSAIGHGDPASAREYRRIREERLNADMTNVYNRKGDTAALFTGYGDDEKNARYFKAFGQTPADSEAYRAFAYATQIINSLTPQQRRTADEQNLLNGKIPAVVSDEAADRLRTSVDNLIAKLNEPVIAEMQ